MKTTISKQDLDFQIYDLGYYEALEANNLTEEKAEKILYGKAQVKVKRPGQYVPYKEEFFEVSWSNDIKELRRVASEKYHELFDEANAQVHLKINARAMSNYDIFSLGLERVLSSNADFQYMNDEQTLNYIRSRIKRAVWAEDAKSKYRPRDLEYRDDLLVNSKMMEEGFDELLLGMKDLDLGIVDLTIAGYNQKEISDKMSISQQYVSKRLSKIYKHLKQTA